MELQTAKHALLEATRKLLESGLVVRTWGNISCKVGQDQFLITPSGKSYDRMTEDQLVLVSQKDLSYSGSIKPSSEKGMHAIVYRNKPQANCIIHTHQEMASLVSLLGQELSIPDEYRQLLGDRIQTARYGLPGTKILQNKVEKVLDNKASTAVLLSKHGALCYGENPQTTFRIAEALETVSQDRIYKLSPLLKMLGQTNQVNWLAKTTDDGTIQYLDTISPSLQAICTEILTKRKDCKIILLHTSAVVSKVMETFPTLYAYLDDFAQIAGVNVPVVGQGSSLPIERCDALLIKEVGALCLGVDEGEAHAVALLVEKNSKAAVLSLASPQVQPLPWVDAHLMRYVYKKKYSKLAR